jgi:hypothetical protein
LRTSADMCAIASDRSPAADLFAVAVVWSVMASSPAGRPRVRRVGVADGCARAGAVGPAAAGVAAAARLGEAHRGEAQKRRAAEEGHRVAAGHLGRLPHHLAQVLAADRLGRVGQRVGDLGEGALLRRALAEVVGRGAQRMGDGGDLLGHRGLARSVCSPAMPRAVSAASATVWRAASAMPLRAGIALAAGFVGPGVLPAPGPVVAPVRVPVWPAPPGFVGPGVPVPAGMPGFAVSGLSVMVSLLRALRSGDELQDGEDHDDHADDVEDAVHRASFPTRPARVAAPQSFPAEEPPDARFGSRSRPEAG